MIDHGKVQATLLLKGKPLDRLFTKKKKTAVASLAARIPRNGEGWNADGTVRPAYWEDAMNYLEFSYEGQYPESCASAGDHIWLFGFGGLDDELGIGIQVTGVSVFHVGLKVDSPQEEFDGRYEMVLTFFDTPVEAARAGLVLMREYLSNALAQVPDPSQL